MDIPNRVASLLNSRTFTHVRRLWEGGRIQGVMTAACLGIASASALSAAPVVSAVKPSSVVVGAFSLTVTGSGFDSGAVVLFDGVELTTTRRNAKRLIADGTATAAQLGLVDVFVKNPDLTTSNVVQVEVVDGSGGGPGGGGGGNGMSVSEAKRFLERVTWGFTPASIANLQGIGKEAFLEEQFSAPMSDYPGPVDGVNDFRPAQEKFFHNAVHGEDQLRQRMAFILSQIFVVSANTVSSSHQMVPWLHMLRDNAFGNYYDLLRDVTLSPTMGRYLDMVRNQKTDPGSGLNPNENFGRELLQLFTVGTVVLNTDGTPKTDKDGHTTPTYTEDTVLNFARVFTGWGYPTHPLDNTPGFYNPPYYIGPMEPWDNRHDMTEKVLMDGYILPAGRPAVVDLDDALQHVFNHPNIGPFLALRLIRHFVDSNPSSQYIRRVAKVFNNNGSGVRGDLKAVITAVLLDREADKAGGDHGHLREPILLCVAMLRALDAQVSEANILRWRTYKMGQWVFVPPTVFNYFHLLHGGFHGAHGSVEGPEFQIHTYTNAMERVDFVYRVARNQTGTGVAIDLSPFYALTDDPAALLALAEDTLLHESLTDSERTSILNAITDVSPANQQRRVEYAIYLVATSSRYQVQH